MRSKFRIFGIDVRWFMKWLAVDTRAWDKRRGRYLEDGEVPLKKGEEGQQSDQIDSPYYDDTDT